ncbi:MAG: ATP-binding cassette domain-containing protein [Rhodobacteraceae bacterium]|nr:ATP-binding cassette domain-containing protein [Paracoccaceae bacterium]
MVSILPLKLTAATAHMRGKRLVGPVDFTLGSGGMTLVIGPNGAGKTTLLRLMHGLQRCSGGALIWAVPDVEARQSQAFVFQAPIMMRRRVIDSLAYPLRLRGMAKRAARGRAQECAQRFGLEDLLSSWAPMLSGGEKQKLSLARALIVEPEVLFLDEPCANLDGSATREIEAILLAAKAAGTRIVMSTHDMGQAKRLADDVIFMHKGLMHETGVAAEFFATPLTPEARAFIKGDIVE